MIERQLVNNKLERMFKEGVVAVFGALSQNLPGVAEINHEKRQSA
jgi:hypothetical protein